MVASSSPPESKCLRFDANKSRDFDETTAGELKVSTSVENWLSCCPNQEENFSQEGNGLNMKSLLTSLRLSHASDVSYDCQLTVVKFPEKTCRFKEQSGVPHPINRIMSTFRSPPMFFAQRNVWKLAAFQETKKREKRNLNKILKCLIINFNTSYSLFLGGAENEIFFRAITENANMVKMSHF